MTTNTANENGIADVLSSVTESPHSMDLKHQLEHAAPDVNKLKADRNDEQSQNNQCSETVRVIDQKVKRMKFSIRLDNTMSSQVNDLQMQLQAAVAQKLDAIARLQTVEVGNELAISSIEGKQTNGDVEHLSIASVTDNLTENVLELMAVHSKLTTAIAQLEIEIKEKTEQLSVANLTIFELSETNEKLKNENAEYVRKLSEQLNESHKVMKAYDMDLKAKTELLELYKENNVDYQAENDELAAVVTELKRVLNETFEGCGIIETRLKQNEFDYQMLSDSQDEITAKLKQELSDANRLLKECASVEGNNQEMDGDCLSLSERPTFTKIYSQYCHVLKDLRNKEQECKLLEAKITDIINDAKEKNKEFERQQNEMKKQQATNEQIIEERQRSLVETIVVREDLQICRLRCKLLQDESNKMKSFGSECLKKFIRTVPPIDLDNVNVDRPLIQTNSCSVELQKQHRELVDMVSDFDVKFNATETNSETKENMIMVANTCVNSTANVCDNEIVSSVTELNSDSREVQDTQETKLREENLLKIEKLTELNRKLRNEVRELNAENSSIAAAANLWNVRHSILQQLFESLEKQNQTYVDEIDEGKIATKHLREETANAMNKSFTAEIRCEHLQNEHRSLSMAIQSLTAELEVLKKELAEEKISSQKLRECLVVMKTKRLKARTQIGMETGNSQESSTTILQTGVVTTDLSRDDVSSSKKKQFSQSERASLPSTSSPDSRKRCSHEVNPSDSASSKRHRSSRKPRVPVSLLDRVNVCDDDSGRDLSNIKLQYASESPSVVQSKCGSRRKR